MVPKHISLNPGKDYWNCTVKSAFAGRALVALLHCDRRSGQEVRLEFVTVKDCCVCKQHLLPIQALRLCPVMDMIQSPPTSS